MNTITDRIGLHSVGRNEVLLPINHNYNKICDVLALNTRQHKKFYEFSYMLWKKAIQVCMCDGAYCPIS